MKSGDILQHLMPNLCLYKALLNKLLALNHQVYEGVLIDLVLSRTFIRRVSLTAPPGRW